MTSLKMTSVQTNKLILETKLKLEFIWPQQSLTPRVIKSSINAKAAQLQPTFKAFDIHAAWFGEARHGA